MIIDTMAMMLTADCLWTPELRVDNPILKIEDHLIDSIASRDSSELPSGGELHSFPGCTMAPAFFDVHVHGGGGQDVMHGGASAIEAVSHFLATRGVGAYLATTVTAPLEATLQALDEISNEVERGGQGAQVKGIHLEGPFLSHIKRGVHPPDSLLPPSAKVFDRFWQAAQGHIRLMTIAPELPGACELIQHATALGVRVSMGHSDSGSAAARQAIEAGVVSATHTFNAMRPLDHRHPGILGVVLTTDELFAEIICDGIHVDPAVVRLFWKAKGSERALLVTDGISATGMPDGTYMLGDLAVEVSNGKCLYNGVLAGSVLTMDRAVRNFQAFTGASQGEAIALAARNPARMTGLEKSVGSLAAGRRADVVVLSATGEVVATVLGGRFTYRACR